MNNKESQNKKLPIKKPSITSYQSHATLFSILENNPHSMSWIFNHYLQLNMARENNVLDFYVGGYLGYYGHWKCCPLITCHGVSTDFIKSKWESVTDFLIDCVDSGYHVFFSIDEFYIPEYPDYNKIHYIHPMLVSGYNHLTNTFDIADFFKNQTYYFSTATYKEVEAAYNALEELDQLHDINNIGEFLMVKPKESAGYSFNINLTLELLNDYLLGNDSSKKHRLIDIYSVNKIYGIDVYKNIEQILTLSLKGEDRVNLITFHVLYDHKKLMCLLLKFLWSKGYISNPAYYYESYKKLESTALNIRDLLLRWKITKKTVVIEKAIALLKKLAEDEYSLIKNMINDIRTEPKITVPSNEIIESTNFFISYSEGWITNESGSNTQFGAAAYSGVSDSYAQLTFFGDSISYYATMSKNCGKVDIIIDGVKYQTIDLYSEETICKKLVFHKTGLNIGYHILRIVALPTNEAKSFVTLDSLQCGLNTSIVSKPKNLVKFLSIDTETQGSWITKYGNDGYDIICCDKKIPTYASIQYPDDGVQVYNPNTTEMRILENPYIDSGRIGAICFAASLTINIIICGDIEKKVSVYILDWWEVSGAVKVELFDGESNEIIDTQVINDYSKGVYVNYFIKGRARLKFTGMFISYAMFSGIFFK